MIRPVAADGRIETGGAFTPVLRPRVVDRIASAAAQRIVLIIAPAGYGKSVALKQYLETLEGVPHLCYNVHAENGTLLGFVRGFSDAIAEVAPDARKTVSGAYERSRSSKTPGLDLAMWMHAHIKAFTGVIAIDDLHLVENEPEVSKFLVSLIERTKGRSRWIIASRSSLDLPVGSWLAYGEMDLNVDEQDLRFTMEEARETAKASRVGVRDEELAEILSMTQGWPTALSFALRTSTRSIDLRNISATTREMVYKYLAEQVYRSLEAHERELLHFIGFLPEIDVEVLRVAGYSKGKALLEALRDRVAFIYPERPGVYLCHDLFRDFLRHQVELEGASAAEETACRAGAALEGAGQTAPALAVYAQARSIVDVLRILEAHGFALMDHGHADVVQSAVDVLPQDVRATHPMVLGMRALGEAHTGRYDRAESLLTRAMARTGNEDLNALLAVRAALIAINLGRDATALLEPLTGMDALALNVRADILSLIAVAYANAGKHDGARWAMESAELLADEMDDPSERSKILQRLGAAAMQMRVAAHEVERYVTRAVTLASGCGTFVVAARGYGVLANVALMYDDDLTRCAWYAQQGMGAATKAGDRLGLQTALLQLINVEITRGNAERLHVLERQFADAATSDTARMVLVIPAKAVLCAWEGRFDEAHRLLSTAIDRIADNSSKAYLSSLSALALAVEGHADRAAAVVRSALSFADQSMEFAYTRKQAALARAFCAAAEALSGRGTNASRILQKLNADATPLVEAVRETVSALVRAAKNPVLKEDLADRFHALDAMGHAGVRKVLSAAAEQGLRQHGPDSALLTKAELSVLNALAEGMGPKDIALETGRSVYTIQVHIKNAIKKLGCSGRNEALTLARKRGLIG